MQEYNHTLDAKIKEIADPGEPSVVDTMGVAITVETAEDIQGTTSDTNINSLNHGGNDDEPNHMAI